MINPIDWEARTNAVNAQKAAWLDKNSDQLKLIQFVIGQAYDVYQEADFNNAANDFMHSTDDAISALITTIADLRNQNFVEAANLPSLNSNEN
jgi:hypothetical protein